MPGKLAKSRCLALCCMLGLTTIANADETLHQRIDRLVTAGFVEFKVKPATRSSDEEFLRRIYLDLTGTIPTTVAARQFLGDSAPDKRGKLIERLLASPEHARHLQQVFDVIFMERRPDKHVPRPQWQEYLRTSFAVNIPWDVLVREILTADGADAKSRPAAKYYLEREADPNLIARDLSRLFLGRNIQCAQCHDHPLVEDYKQADYYGILAFLNRSSLFTDQKNVAMLAEKADGEVSFQSVFDPAKVTKTSGPRLPGRPPIQEPKLDKGKEYTVAPAKGVRPVPAFSRRAQLASQITSPDNKAFQRASVNRFWSLLFGRGLIHPLDLDQSANPPSHPELLDLLAREFVATKYDIRALLREIASSDTYQRSSIPAGPETAPETLATAQLKPLSPEQLAWSLMQAAGLADSERIALGKRLNEQTLYAKLSGQGTPVITTFAGPAGQPEGQGFQASLDQALFLRNGGLIRGWLAPRTGNLTDRLLKIPDANAAAEELYLSVLTRRPKPEEAGEVAAYLQGRMKDRQAAMQEMAWALITSAEFRFNH